MYNVGRFFFNLFSEWIFGRIWGGEPADGWLVSVCARLRERLCLCLCTL